MTHPCFPYNKCAYNYTGIKQYNQQLLVLYKMATHEGTWRKTLNARKRTNNILNMTPHQGIANVHELEILAQSMMGK
jgi:hypothetical protein